MSSTSTDAPTTLDEKAPTGGQNNLSGVLYQLLATLRSGLDGVITNVEVTEELAGALIIVEPAAGGDAQLIGPAMRTVDQIKIRRGSKTWSTGEIVRKVLPDLFKAFEVATPSTYRFLTDNADGTADMSAFLAVVRQLSTQSRGHDALEASAKLHRWGNEHVSGARLFAEILTVLQAEPEAVWAFLACCDLVVQAEEELEHDIRGALEKIVDEREEIRVKLNAMIAELIRRGGKGGSLSVSDLLLAVDLDPKRLSHLSRLPGTLRAQVEKKARLFEYNAAMDVRAKPVLPDDSLVVLSGDSGQGKTWRLCRAALDDVHEGRLALLLRPGSRTLAGVENEILKSIWLTDFDRSLPLERVAQPLRPKLAGSGTFWLTVYLDDLNNVELAKQLAEQPWASHGIRIVVSAQHRITRLLATRIKGLPEVAVPDFTSAELRDYLRRSGRNPARVPDDVLQSLLRPSLAWVYTQIPDSQEWSSANEYELMDGYFDWATKKNRDQPLHLSDGAAVLRLAGTLLGDTVIYPWSETVTRNCALADDVKSRLIEIGVLREDDEGRLLTAHDRMLNWAVAKEILRRYEEGDLNLEGVSAQLAKLAGISTVSANQLGHRLGYVPHDVLWLFARRQKPETTGQLVLLSIRSGFSRREHEHFFAEGLGGFGKSAVPVLTWLAKQASDERQVFLPQYIAAAFLRVARIDAVSVTKAANALVRENIERSRDVGLRVLASNPSAGELDLLWSILMEREAAVNAAKSAADHQWMRLVDDKERAIKAITSCAGLSESWLRKRGLAVTTAAEAIQLLWLLVRVDVVLAKQIWVEAKIHLLALIPAGNTVIPRAIRHFRDAGELHRASSLPADADEHTQALWFDALARMDREAAFQRLGSLGSRELWGTTDWWLPGLDYRASGSIQKRLLETIGREDGKAGPAPYELALLYGDRTDLIDPATFDAFIDGYESLLEAAEPSADFSRLGWRLRSTIAEASSPVLLERLAARRGSRFEELVVRAAKARRGRIDMHVDDEGEDYFRILGAIGGVGYDQLVGADLERDGEHARTDAVVAAMWTRNETIKARLVVLADGQHPDTYGRLQLQKSLASHRADRGLSIMVRNGAPAYLTAAEIRGEDTPWSDSDLAEVRRLLQSADLEERLRGMTLCGFLGRGQAASLLLPFLTTSSSCDQEIRRAFGVLSHINVYDPYVLPRLVQQLGYNEQGTSIASYLAWSGDPEARQHVAEWLAGHPLNEMRSTETSIARHLLKFDESREAARNFLRRVIDRGMGYGEEGVIWSALAEAGDNEAAAKLDAIAYQNPRSGDASTVAAIRALGKTSVSEAFEAAERLYHRKRSSSAASLLMELDAERGMEVLVFDCAQAPVSIWRQTGIILRRKAPREKLVQRLQALSQDKDGARRTVAAELLGWLPFDVHAPGLDKLVDDEVDAVEQAALRAFRRRRAEEQCAELIKALPDQPRPRQWAHLNAIMGLCDPDVLGSRNDPRALNPALAGLGEDFMEEANRLATRRRKKIEQEADRLEKARWR